ncbi:SIR2 family protein [Roseovarius sp. B08]|uniref:SIR2 family protein n=1 Tax=Roseovarius sp. B08 TaxID=3449223 RepID=UPI003EDBFA56
MDFKKQLFCQFSGTSRKQVDSNDPLWVERIELFLSRRSILPPKDDPTEYAAAFEAVYPSQEDRRSYIEQAVTKGTPSFAHRGLAALISSGQVPCIFTTNFDSMIETAATVTDQLLAAPARANLTVAGIDNADRASRCLRESQWPLLAKVHGDFQSVDLKNTSEELATQDLKMRSVLTGACGRFGLIVVGYSGRDQSVMEALTDALKEANAFPSGIVWTCRSASRLLPAVVEFLNAAHSAGVTTSVLECHTFDELIADVLDGIKLPDELEKHVLQEWPSEINKSAPLPTGDHLRFPVLQSSALPLIEWPKFARKIKLSSSLDTRQAQEVLKVSQKMGAVASTGRELAAFGADDDLLVAFAEQGAELAGTIDLNIAEDSWAMGLVYDALVHAICREQALAPRLRRNGHLVVFSHAKRDEDEAAQRERKSLQSGPQAAYSASLTGMIPNHKGFLFNEGARIKLDRVLDGWWCVFEPTTVVRSPQTEDPETQKRHKGVVADWTRERWARRYNNVWAKIIAAWIPLIAREDSGKLQAFGVGERNGVDAKFVISPVPAWSRPSHDHPYFQRA